MDYGVTVFPTTKLFMRTQYKRILFLALGAFCLGVGTPLRAATVIFNNSTNDLVTRFDAGTNEVGDEILLAGTERYLWRFSFEFWGTNSTGSSSFAGSVEARVRFYQNNGALFNGYPTPGTNFYDSSWFPISATPRSTENFFVGSDFAWTGLFLPVTSNMTWSVQFRGMGATDSVGVDLYTPPVVGQDYPDYWLNTNGNWMLMTNNSGVHVDFGAVMEARALPQPYLTNSTFGPFLLLSWDHDFIGWKLQTQTNSPGVGITTNWHTMPETSAYTQWVLSIDKANGSVFSRLISP